jgi:enoyl-CoA hydratase
MSEDLVTIEHHGDKIAVLRINRPDALNALNLEVLRSLASAVEGEQARGTTVLVLTGSGAKAFVAGADIEQMQDFDRSEATQFARYGQRVFNMLTLYRGVTIAAVNGFALGGGMEMAMACDLILLDEKARLGQPEVSLAVIPGFGGTQRLVRLAGAQRARELIFTGRTIKAEEAVSLGIGLAIYPTGTVLEEALSIAKVICTKGPVAIRLAKQSCANGERFDPAIGFQEEADMFGKCFDTVDQKEGMIAFLEKRPAQFQGR